MISVSFFSEKNNIEEVIKKIDNTTCDYIHVDIADNIFVPNKSLDDNLLVNILSNTEHKKDIHLMVKDVKKYIDIYKELNPEFITFHVETDNVLDMINYIKSLNIKVGLALDLDSDVNLLNDYLDKIDLVLLMSVKAGFGGQEFSDKVFDKISYLKDKNVLIEVDGWINNKNYKLIDSDIKVVGSYITNSEAYEETIIKLKQ